MDVVSAAEKTLSEQIGHNQSIFKFLKYFFGKKQKRMMILFKYRASRAHRV